MILETICALPKNLFENSNYSLAELSQQSGIESGRLLRIIEGSNVPTFEEINSIQKSIRINDDEIAAILNS